MQSNPFFSVIIPVHNKLAQLNRSITSVLNQTYSNFELILVDDASIDASSNVIVQFADPRIRICRRTEAGADSYSARKLGISQAKFDWVCFLDAEDEWDINLLETVKSTIEKHGDLECITWGYTRAMENERWTDKTSLKNRAHNFRFFSLVDFFNQGHTLSRAAVAFNRYLIQNSNYLDAVGMASTQVKTDPSYLFTSFFQDHKGTADQDLVKSIKNYLNGLEFSKVRAQIIEGQGKDYTILKKMNVSSDALVLMGKLVFNKLKSGFKKLRNLRVRKEQMQPDLDNQFFQPLYDFDE